MSSTITVKTNNFIAGSVAQQWLQRTDLQQSQSLILRESNNFWAKQDGSLRRRRGFHNLTGVTGLTDAILIPFSRSLTDSFVLVFGSDNRVYGCTRDGFITDANGNIYSIASPYDFTELKDDEGRILLSYTQVGDSIFFAHKKYHVRVFARYATNNWGFRLANFIGGVFDSYNENQALRIAISGSIPTTKGATVTLVSSSALWTSADVGRLITIDAVNKLYPAWQSNYDGYSVGDFVVSGNSVYKLLSKNAQTTTGVTAPYTLDGVCNDGRFTWKYIHSGYCVFTITAFTSSTQVTAVADSRMFVPPELCQSGTVSFAEDGASSYDWAMGIYGYQGIYPSVVTMFHNRLVYGISLPFGSYLCASCYDLFEDFSIETAGQVLATNSIKLQLNDSSSFDDITTISNKDDVLLCATTSALYACKLDAPTSGGVAKDLISLIGASNVEMIKLQDAQFYVSTSGKTIYQTGFVYTSQTYKSKKVSEYGDDVLNAGILSLNRLWFDEEVIVGYTGDGQGFFWQYDLDAQLQGFFPFSLDGVIQSMAVVYKDGGLQDLFVAINNNTYTYICWSSESDKNEIVLLDYTEQLSVGDSATNTLVITNPALQIIGDTLEVVLNGRYVGKAILQNDFTIILPSGVYAQPSDNVVVGKAYTSNIEIEPFNYSNEWLRVDAIKLVELMLLQAVEFEYSGDNNEWFKWNIITPSTEFNVGMSGMINYIDPFIGTARLENICGVSYNGLIESNGYIKPQTGVKIRTTYPFELHISGLGVVYQVAT